MKYLHLLLLLIPVFGVASAPATLISDGPHPDAPEQLMEYGQLVGNWQCQSSSRQQDGTWKDSPGLATWTWYFVLDGHAVLDVWNPLPNAEGKVLPGTNLRTYNPTTGLWEVAWTVTSSPGIETFISSYRNDAIHITTERAARGAFPAHMMHITFHNITAAHFDWKYEFSQLTDGQSWTEVSRLSCDRVGESADTSG